MPPRAITIGNATGKTQIAGTKLRTPQANRNHGQYVIETRNWVTHSGQKPARFAFSDVGIRYLRKLDGQSQHRQASEMCAAKCRSHRITPINIATRCIVQNAPSEPTV